MTKLIREKYEDGSEYIFDADLCKDVANTVIAKLAKYDKENYDFLATILALNTLTVDILLDAGWKAQHLIDSIKLASDMSPDRVLH